MLVSAESSLQVGFTPCEEPSLNQAVAEYCAALFSSTETGPLIVSAVKLAGVGIFTTRTTWLALRVTPAIVQVAETVTAVSELTSPAASNPPLEMLVAEEFSDQLGETDCDEPSLKMATAANCPELFSLIELGPLIAR